MLEVVEGWWVLGVGGAGVVDALDAGAAVVDGGEGEAFGDVWFGGAGGGVGVEAVGIEGGDEGEAVFFPAVMEFFDGGLVEGVGGDFAGGDGVEGAAEFVEDAEEVVGRVLVLGGGFGVGWECFAVAGEAGFCGGFGVEADIVSGEGEEGECGAAGGFGFFGVEEVDEDLDGGGDGALAEEFGMEGDEAAFVALVAGEFGGVEEGFELGVGDVEEGAEFGGFGVEVGDGFAEGGGGEEGAVRRGGWCVGGGGHARLLSGGGLIGLIGFIGNW